MNKTPQGWKVSTYVLIIVTGVLAGLLVRSCSHKPNVVTIHDTTYVERGDSLKRVSDSLLVSIDSMKRAFVPAQRIKDRLKVIRRDSLVAYEVCEVMSVCDSAITEIEKRDAVIALQDTAILVLNEAYANMKMQRGVDSTEIARLLKSDKRERFWKRFWIGVAGIGLIL